MFTTYSAFEAAHGNTHVLHHTATANGYISRRSDTCRVEPYSGRFGTGYKVYHANFGSTRYCFVSYWIQK